jgi:hypothetical protein
MEKGATVGVTVVAGDTPNERVTIEASYGTVALRISHDAIANVHRMFLTTPFLLPPSSLACLSLEQWVCPGIWTDTREDFRRISTVAVGGGAGRLSDRLVGLAVR